MGCKWLFSETILFSDSLLSWLWSINILWWNAHIQSLPKHLHKLHLISFHWSGVSVGVTAATASHRVTSGSVQMNHTRLIPSGTGEDVDLSFQFCIVTCFHLWPVFLMLPFKEDLNWTFNLLNTEPVFVVVQSKMWSSTCTPTIMDVIEDIRSVASQSRTEHGFVCLLKGYRFGNLRKIQNKS